MAFNTNFAFPTPIIDSHLSNFGQVHLTGVVAPGFDYDCNQHKPLIFVTNAVSNRSCNLTLENSSAMNTQHLHFIVWDGFGDVVLLAQGTDTINGGASATFSGTAGDERATIVVVACNGAGGKYKAGAFHAESHLVPSAVSPNVQLSAALAINAGREDGANSLGLSLTDAQTFVGKLGAGSIALADLGATPSAGTTIGDGAVAIGNIDANVSANAVSIGASASTVGAAAVVVGSAAAAVAADAILIGDAAAALGQGAIAIGANITGALAAGEICIGDGCAASGVADRLSIQGEGNFILFFIFIIFILFYYYF